MVKIKTLEHDLTIIADEFVSNHSIIQNFQEEQTAKEDEDGKSGGHVFIQAKTAKGNLRLILNGRGDRIRTCDPLVPNQMRYRTALLPDG